MALKQDGAHFAFCPKQSNKIEGFVLNRVYPGIPGMGTSDCPLPYRKVLIKN